MYIQRFQTFSNHGNSCWELGIRSAMDKDDITAVLLEAKVPWPPNTSILDLRGHCKNQQRVTVAMIWR
jgi:hypothetical protein